jgi:DNA repair exonuclease SbcCD nuclease subunit
MALDSFKFLHAADIHLDSPLRGLSRYEGVPADVVRTATRDALNNLVDLAIEENVAFVIIAGDLYDGDWEDIGTGLFFCSAMGRLGRAGIDAYLLYGNHDAESSITRRLPLPENVHVFSAKAPETFEHERTATLLHGQSYKDRDPGCNLAVAYPAAFAGRLNIGVLHTSLQGHADHAPYSPCDPAELAAKGYNYWALGHVHGFAVVREDPHIVFPGNLQGRNVRETGAKGATLVTAGPGGISSVEHVPLDVVRWARIAVDATGLAGPAEVEKAVRSAIAAASDTEAGGRPLVVRIDISGQTAAHDALVGRRQDLRDDVRAIATSTSDRIWIEKVRLRTEPVPSSVAPGAWASDDLTALLANAHGDADLREALRAELDELATRLPADLGGDSELIAAMRSGDYDTIIAQAAESLRLRLSKGHSA